jgi:hypothetical protein
VIDEGRGRMSWMKDERSKGLFTLIGSFDMFTALLLYIPIGSIPYLGCIG